MIVEVGLGCLLTFAGFGALLTVRETTAPAARMWLSVPVGMAFYLFASLGLIVVTGTLDPSVAVGIAVVLGLCGTLLSIVRSGFHVSDLAWLASGIGIAAITVVLARVWHLTRLSPDSIRYLLGAVDLVEPDAIAEMNRADLLIRQIGLPSLQAMADLIDRRYLASLAPLYGVSGLGLFVWFTTTMTTGVEIKRRRWMVLSATLFLLSSNRLVYDSFYINTHIQMASYVLIAVVGFWLAVSRDLTGWALPAGFALGAMVLLRPEAPLVVAVVLVAVAASRASWPLRVMAVVPVVLVTAVWYGIVLRENARGGRAISLTAPVFGSVVAVAGSALAVWVGGLRRLRSVTRHLDAVGLIGISGLLIFFTSRTPQVLIDSVVHTLRNITYDGLWLLTWCAALVLLVIAILVHQVEDGRLWTVPIVGFGLLFWLLPLIREGAWRIGPGDSGNRILAHILAVVVAFLVMSTLDSRSGRPDIGRSGE